MAINWEMGVTDPLRGVNQGLASLGQALQYQQKQGMLEEAQKRQNSLADLQMQQSRAAIADTEAKQKGMQTAYGVTTPEAAYTKQYQSEQAAALAKQAAEKQKAVGDVYTRTSSLIEKGVVDPDVATKLFHHDLKGLGVDLSAAGMDFSFKNNAGYFSGPVSPQSLVLIGGKPTPYGASGIAKDWKVSGLTPEGQPIFEIPKGGEFKTETKVPMTTRDMPIAGGMMQRMQFNPVTGKDEPYGVPFKPVAQQRLEIGEKPKPAKPLPAGQLESLSDASQLIKTLKEAQGISPKVNTGMVAGRLQSLGQKFGATDENFNQLKQKLSTVENIMLKLRSGAAVTESEYSRFMNEMPTVNDDEKVRDTKMNNAIKYAEELLSGKTATYEEGGYKVPTGLTTRSQPNQQPKGKPAARPPLSAIFGK